MKPNLKSNEVDMKLVVEEFTTPVKKVKNTNEDVLSGLNLIKEAEAKLYDVKDYTQLNKIDELVQSIKGGEV
jgi:hypothetical protein